MALPSPAHACIPGAGGAEQDQATGFDQKAEVAGLFRN